MKIKDLAKISLGYSFRTALVDDTKGNILVIQPKNILDTGALDLNNCTKSHMSPLKENMMLKDKDVLLTIRGKFISAVFRKFKNKKHMTTSSILAIRIINKKFYPEYVSLFLNSQEGKKRLNSLILLTTIFSINKENVSNIMIPDMSLEKQRQLIEINSNMTTYKYFLDKKLKLEEMIINNKIRKIMEGKKHE